MATSQYIGPSVSVGGAVPAGTGTEVQYRSSGSAFGAVAGSSWDGSTLTLPSITGTGIFFTDANGPNISSQADGVLSLAATNGLSSSYVGYIEMQSTGAIVLAGTGGSSFNADSGDLTLSTTGSGDVNVTSAGAINLNSNANVGGVAGVRLSAANGILTLLGLGDGADENLLLDFNTTANTVLITSGTGVTKLDFGSIILEGAFSAADGSAGFTGTACTAFKNGLCVSGT